MPGTSLRATAGRGAQAYLDDLAALRAEHLASDADGFEHYRLHL
jgi:hypothetical protein